MPDSSFDADANIAPSRAERRAAFAAARAVPNDWGEVDLSILEEKRAAVPPFPLDLLPQPWRDWTRDTASSTAAPVDYVAQTVLAALAGLSGAGVVVRITPAWSEPLLLWQTMVGEPSTGKSSALAPMRRLLGTIEEERRALDDERRERHAERARTAGAGDAFVPSQVVVADAAVESIAVVISGNPRGVISWRDGPPAWFADDGKGRSRWLQAWNAGAVTIERQRGEMPLHLESLPVSVLATIRPDRLQAALREGDDALAARFLYAWPGAQPYRALADLRLARDDEALAMLRRLSRLARTPGDPLVLVFDQHGVKALDGFLAGLHAERGKAEGLEAAWLGKGGAAVARLAGALELLAWSGSGAPGLPGHIGRDQVEAAANLWTGYFRPHARALFDRVAPTDYSGRVRRVARWLKDSRATVVSREDVRCHALSRTVNADEAQQILYRLDFLGFVRPDLADDGGGRGRPARRWQINPALGGAQPDYRTTGNTGK
jgi:Protein of unknown function (DUF3987)